MTLVIFALIQWIVGFLLVIIEQSRDEDVTLNSVFVALVITMIFGWFFVLEFIFVDMGNIVVIKKRRKN